MRKISCYMHVSLDGFVAGNNGELDWVQLDESLFDFIGEKTATADAAIYGRKTYQIMEAYWPTAGTKTGATKHDREHSAWYMEVKKYVLSKTLLANENPSIHLISHQIGEKINALKNELGSDIILFGSPSVVQLFIAENLVDEIYLFINPVILGKGKPLFGQFHDLKKLQLLEHKVFNCGVIELKYQLKKPTDPSALPDS